MELKLNDAASLNTRLYVSPAPGDNAQKEQGDHGSITLRRPTTAETFSRRLLNALSFGAYTAKVVNPREWKAFRMAVLTQLNKENPQGAGQSGRNRELVDEALRSYSQGQRLTSTKAAAILADIRMGRSQGAMFSDHLPHLKYDQYGSTDVGRSGVARAANAVKQTLVGSGNINLRLIADEIAPYEAQLSALENAEKARKEAWQGRTDNSNYGGSLMLSRRDPPAECRAAFDALKSLVNSGGPIKNHALTLGMRALEYIPSQAPRQDIFFRHPESYRMPLHQPTGQRCSEYLGEIGAKIAGDPDVRKCFDIYQADSNRGARSIVAIPLALNSGGKGEGHSVLVALDLQKKQVLYFDAKGDSPRAAERHYDNAAGLQTALEGLGKATFGAEWNASNGLLMLSNAKQQNAHDGVAFTQEFTRRLLRGETLGDIERTFTTFDRDGESRADYRRRMNFEASMVIPPTTGTPPDAPGSRSSDGIRARMAREILSYEKGDLGVMVSLTEGIQASIAESKR